MKKRIFITGFLLIVFTCSMWSQVAMGKWSTHFAYNSVSQIAQSDAKIYAVSNGALFSVDKLDGSIEFYSKLSGLNGSNITRIDYDSTNQELLIIYSNGNIDVMSASGVSNIPDFFNKQMSKSKSVNQIQFYNNKEYLSCDFGIIVLNMQKKEVADTYYIGPNASEVKVLNTTINKGTIYALTASTVFIASVTNPQLVNYAEWSAMAGLPGTGDFQKIGSFGGQLILLRGGYLYKQETNNLWTPLLPAVTVTDFNVNNESLNVFTPNTVYLVNNLFNAVPVSNIGTISDAEYDSKNNTYYFAANNLGIISYKQTSTETPVINYFKPNGPAVNSPWDMTFSGKKLFVVPGGRWVFLLYPGYVMMLENNVWTNISYDAIEANTGVICRDLIATAIDPKDNTHFFAASYSSGLYEFKNNKFYKYHNFTNSTIENLFGSYQYQMMGGCTYDQDGNLWLLNEFVKNGIKVYLADGTWTQLTYPGVDNKPSMGKLMISNLNKNQKIIFSARAPIGICAFDDNGTIKDQSDDKSVFIPSFTYPEQDKNGQTKLVSIIPRVLNCMAQDKNGVVWVGTDVGPFLFNNLSKIYEADYTCSRVKIPRNDSTNLADYLLVNENITAIAIDGANRKWIGTNSSGVYLMSENGQQTIQHFTLSNSPLLSNSILSIAINPLTGEVFIGTDQGVLSYQSDASEAGNTFGEVYAYPNPVRQGFTGVITITGLMDKTQVKITDITGNLICETVSNGSIATWDGKDVHGRKVSTGIYLAICANPDGTQSTITKILVIN
jgi:hypothetical protein